MIKVVLDAMGGDFAPDEVLQGAYLALRELPVHIILTGPEDILKKELPRWGEWPNDRISIVHASQIVEMAESPSQSFRKKKDSSIRVGLDLVRDKKADAFVSAGNTGAALTASTLILGRINGVERPAAVTVLPSENGQFVMLDMGTNVDCKSNHLVQFAVMGECFAKLVLGIEKPRVALLNIGEEPDKGNLVTQATFELLQQAPVHFIGNVEGKEILQGKADVVVCDGFVGNNLLKFGEGVSALFMDFFKKEAKSSWLSMLALMLLKPALYRFKKRYDYEEYGGAPILGVNGVSIIAHGRSKSVAIKNAIRTAVVSVQSEMVDRLTKALDK